ncbi:MAG: histidinol-phosphate transaminase [Bacteroidota bacterium]
MIREEITSLAEYHLPQYPYRIKLNQNENPFELPRSVKEEITERIAGLEWSRYPAFVPQEQIERVAEFSHWRSDGVLLGNGSNDLLQLLFMSVLDRGKGVVISQPTFTLYKILAQSLGATVHEVPMTQDFQFDVNRIISTVQETHASLLVLCSPNNPTGSYLAREDLVRILVSTTALVLLDEAYVQFAPESQVSLLPDHERLVLLQTFSKAMGAAALRFGYSLASPALTGQLKKVHLPYSINAFTLAAVDILLERWETYRGWIEIIIQEREKLFRALSALEGLVTHPSRANFLLLETTKRTPGEVFQALLQREILIRDVSSYPMLARGLRVSVGTPEENKTFVAALQEALA